jgi:histidine triad (HIT) family protein
MILTASRIAREAGHKGYKFVWNVGKDGGQVIFHTHLHLLAGKKMKEV